MCKGPDSSQRGEDEHKLLASACHLARIVIDRNSKYTTHRDAFAINALDGCRKPEKTVRHIYIQVHMQIVALWEKNVGMSVIRSFRQSMTDVDLTRPPLPSTTDLSSEEWVWDFLDDEVQVLRWLPPKLIASLVYD